MSDVLVIGAGPDELVAARLLQQAGHRVTVVQEHALHDRVDGWAPAQLGGLQTTRPDPWLRTNDGLELFADVQRSAQSIGRLSARDAQRWPEFCERMARLAGLLEKIYLQAPPSLIDLRFALRVRRLGRRGMEDLMRVLPMPASELLDEWFESDILKGALCAFAVRDLQQGPRSAGTAFRLLHAHVGSPRGVFRPGTVDVAPLRSGLTMREAQVARIDVRGGAVSGATLANGETLPATIVVAGAHPGRVLGELVEPGWIDPDLVRAARRIRSRGVAARARLELERAPQWPTLTLAGTADDVERAYDAVKYGRISERPVIDAVADGAALDVHLQFVPHTAADTADIQARLVKVLQPHVPPIRRVSVRTPVDLERTYGWPQGQPHHAELSLDQALWMRPLPELAGYKTPVAGLWLCGPAMHPGAGVIGAAGYNCARAMQKS
ncbi:MAG TPA: NAD(P)/FAD-dependent oxidoreductase [Burkholderiales bacterium]|nr:NAD(P)/FAD-dependent oxidoreductase [Burkholderiales bacterium]